ncbi:MAG: hypothetical protein LQ343_007583 [Gyalolechia ehrenbergii]|nr:MAG: hypothetical protein LQ343_007583 [Gyalolechia ehrenbergii]
MQSLGLKILLSTCARAHGACTASSPTSHIDGSIMGYLAEIVSKDGHTLNDKTSALSCVRSQLGSESYAHLVHLMKTKLPQEIVDLIEETVFQHAFCPGVVFFPHQPYHKDTVMWEGKTYYAVRPELLALSKAVHLKWQSRLWTDNIYVLGEKSTSLMKRLHEDRNAGRPHKDIRIAHAVFTLRLCEEGFPRYPAGIRCYLGSLFDMYNSWRYPGRSGTRSRLDGIIAQAQLRWYLELLRIPRVFPVTKLTLDFNKYYLADGRGLGLEWILSRFDTVHI